MKFLPRVAAVTLIGLFAWLGHTVVADAYVHVNAAQEYCRQWNNQSATDNVRYTEASMGRPPYYLMMGYYPSNRFSNNELDVAMQWQEWKETGPRLAIDYVCRVAGTDDQHMTIRAISASSVYWS